ncbi:uncharacterized protein LOC125840542 [Solanum verrucosum]|uniref:uncharacterized protein LOC125840542 n=1 Tax=Solanum verrucosum TaxID=315347 RepID=UPI0020D1316B|nr:uncharacterized protein LOC125840542 [Solanum verrucosum]
MDIDCVILEEDEQQITCDIGHNELQTHFNMTFVYAKCKDHLRRPLWDRMIFRAGESNRPWCSVGDYNVITSIEEKLGGVPYNMRKSFNGQKYTWSNNRGIQQRIWKRLDRALVTDAWLEKMPQTTITHLPSVGKACWERTVEGNSMWRFHQKLKRLSTTLSNWSRKEFGDIFTKVREYEERIEDSILKQKTQLQWFKEGDCNTKYFHSLIRGRRRKLFIHKLIREDGEWMQGDDIIAEAACDHFQELFTGENNSSMRVHWSVFPGWSLRSRITA